MVEPLEYEPFANLMHKSTLVLTDSDGVQEEAPPREAGARLHDATERSEAVKAGTVLLVGTEEECVYYEAQNC